jgi:hypothetical protein
MKKKKSSAAKELKAYESARRKSVFIEGTTRNAPLDDITFRVIVSNIPKHRTTREELEEENSGSGANKGKKTLLAA